MLAEVVGEGKKAGNRRQEIDRHPKHGLHDLHFDQVLLMDLRSFEVVPHL